MTAEVVECSEGRSDGRRRQVPDFVVAGFPKAGTTSLAGHLGMHPDLWIPPQKEIGFFDAHYQRGIAWYEEQFADAPRGALVGDASPTYLVRPEAVERMARDAPDVKVIAILRNPVDRAFSHYRFREAWAPQRTSFGDAVAREMGDDAESVGLLAWGRYIEHLDLLARFVDRQQIEVVLLDDLVADPAAVLAGLFRFLGIDARVDLPVVADVQNRAFRFRSVKLWHFMMSHRLWRRLPLGLGSALHRLNQVPLPNVSMDAEVRRALLEYFEPHNARLAGWLGKDLRRWTT